MVSPGLATAGVMSNADIAGMEDEDMEDAASPAGVGVTSALMGTAATVVGGV